MKTLKLSSKALSALSILVVLVSLLPASHAAAFNSTNLIDDSVFDNSASLSPGQVYPGSNIDAWINNNFPSSCIGNRGGFQFRAPRPTGYSPSTGFTYGSSVTAGEVINDAASAYGLNPEVLLTTLQKEQSLVSGGAGCSVLAYTGATGYGCPDSGPPGGYSYSGVNLYTINGVTTTSVSGTCVNSAAKAGFSQQVVHAAWLLKFGEQRSEGNTGFNVQFTNFPEPGDRWDNSDDPPTCYGGPMTQGSFKRCSSDTNPVFYDGFITIDGASTHMDTGATAALYWYTPHFAGNQNFDNLFTAWFGSLYGNTIGSSAYRMYNSKTRTHYYTARQNERASAKQQGFVDDGTAFNVVSSQLPGTIPIYNLYRGSITDYWLTPDGPNLYWGAVLGGYGNNGVAFYAYPANPHPTAGSPLCQAGTLPVAQMWSSGATEHFYSVQGIDHYWALIYGGYVDDSSSSYTDPNGAVSFCVPQ